MSTLNAEPSVASSIPLSTLGSPIAVPPEAAVDLVALNASDLGKQIAGWVHDRYRACDSARQNEKRRWYMNLAMYGGDQYADFAATGLKSMGYLYNPPFKRGKERQTINRIRSIIRTELSRITSQKPSASVIPASSEDQDLFAAVAAEQTWQSIVRRQKAHSVFSEAAFWTVVAGTGFMKVYWDDTLKDRDSGMPGDIKFESITPFNLFVPDLRVRDIEDQPYVINMYTRSVDWLRYFFKDQLEGVNLQASTVTQNTLMEEAYAGLRGADEAKPDSCMVYEVWIKPGGCHLIPNGGLVTLVDKTIVGFIDSGIPYQHGEFPFIKFEHIPTARFYADSVIVDLDGLQRDYNALRSQIAETRKKMGKVQIMAPKGTISASKMTNEIGLIVEYKPGFGPPQPMPLAQLPNYILQEQETILRDMEDISGQHQVSKGNVPPGVTAATAISFLQEKDDSYLVHTYQSVEAGWEKIARQTLNLVVQYWDVKRLVKTIGEDGAFDTQMLMGSDLVSGTDISIEAGSALPQSKAARQAYIMDLMTQGFIPPEKGLELLEIGGAQKLLDQLQVDKRQAQRENIKLKSLTPDDFMQYDMAWAQASQAQDMQTVDPTSGQQLIQPPIVTVNTWDNHAVHIEVHNMFRRSQAFDRCSPQVKQAFEQHIQMHKQAQMSDQLEQMLGQIPSDGTVPGVQMPGAEGGDSTGGPPPGGGDPNMKPPGAEEAPGVPQLDPASLGGPTNG